MMTHGTLLVLLQGERYNRPSSAWLERRHHPGLLQAPIFQAVPIPLKPTHDSPVEMRPPSFSWLPKLLLEEPLYPSCRVSDSAFEANYAQHPEPSNSDTEATATAAVEAAVVAALRKQLQDAEAKAATSRKQLAAAEARAAALAAEKSAEFGEVAWLRQQLQEADLEVQEGAEELTKAHAQQQTAAAVAAEQLAILQQKLAAAEAKAAAAEAAAGASMREQKAAEAKHAEQVAGLQTQLQAANNKVVAAEAATAKRVKEAQQAAVDRAAEHIASMHQQLQAVEDRATAAAAYVEELNTLKQQLQVAEAKSAAADAELRRLQVQGGQLEQYLSASAEELRALQANMAAARSALATFDGPSSSTASSNDDKSPTAQLGSKAADGSSKLLSLQQAITQVLGQMAGRCKAAEQQAAACHAEVHEVHSILAGTSTDGAGHATFMTQAGSADELAPDQHSLSVQQLAEAVVKDGQLVKQQAAEAQAQLEAVRSILCAACALEPDVSTPTAHRAPPEHAPSAFDSMTALQLAAAVVQAYQLAQQQSAPALCAQVKDAHALLVAASAACQGASVQAESAEPGKTPSAPAPVQVLQLKKLSAVLVDRYRSTQQQADSSQAQMHEAHAVLQAALSVAAAGSDGQGDLSLQELAAALVDRCMFAELGLDDCRKQVQNELTQLQAACASMRAYFTSTAASKQKQKGHGGKDYWMLQEVRTQLVEAQLNRMCAEQKAAVADAAAAAAVQELERVKQELRAAKSGLLAPTGLTSKQYRELQTLKRELAAAEEKVAASDSELQAMRMQLAETSAACKEAQQAQRWLPEHAAAAMAGVLGVMAVARVSTVRDDHEASAQQEDGGHSAGAGSEQAVVKHAKHPARIPACEHPAALLRLLRDTVHHLQDGQTLPGQYTCSQKELTAAGDVIALREASLGAAEYAVWRSVTLAADAGARARQQFEDRVGPDGKVSAEGLMGCIEDLQRCQHELVVAAGDLILQDLLLALAKQHLHQYQTGWLQLPMPNSDVVQKLLAEAAPVSDACVVAATELQATLSSLTDTQEKGIGDS